MTSRIKANEIDALTAGSALTVNATPTFTKAGTYDYKCDYHSSMTATITVND